VRSTMRSSLNDFHFRLGLFLVQYSTAPINQRAFGSLCVPGTVLYTPRNRQASCAELSG
jgi:hypothetical protein